MSIIDVKSAICDVLEKARASMDNQNVIGKPIYVSPTISIIPLTKVTLGFFSGGTEIDNGKRLGSAADNPVATIGGGITYSPQGFLVVNGENTTLLKLNSDNGGEKWIDLLSNTVKDLLSNQ